MLGHHEEKICQINFKQIFNVFFMFSPLFAEPNNYVCSTCKTKYASAWRLVQHVQHSHGVKIYVESSNNNNNNINNNHHHHHHHLHQLQQLQQNQTKSSTSSSSSASSVNNLSGSSTCSSNNSSSNNNKIS